MSFVWVASPSPGTPRARQRVTSKVTNNTELMINFDTARYIRLTSS